MGIEETLIVHLLVVLAAILLDPRAGQQAVARSAAISRQQIRRKKPEGKSIASTRLATARAAATVARSR